MPLQKTSVEVVPKELPSGTARLPLRQPSVQPTGSSHCRFSAGPVGPEYGPRTRSPHSPANDSQANLPVVGAVGGRRTTSGSTLVDGVRVSSHPMPVSALKPSQSRCEKNCACDPAAGKTTGRSPSSRSEPPVQSLRSPPVCCENPTSVGLVCSAAAAVGTSNMIWSISQSPSWRLFQSLKT